MAESQASLHNRINMTNDPAALYAQLATAFNRRAWQQALGVAAPLLPMAQRHPGVHFMTGIAHMELQQIPQALDHLRKASTLDPARADYAAQLAKALALARKNRDARVVADQAMALAPKDVMTLDTLGVTYSNVGAYESAVTAFRHCVALAPRHAPFRYNLATSLMVCGDIDEAEVEIEACIALDPHYWQAHLTLAQLRRLTPDHHHLQRLESLLPEAERKTGDAQAQVCLHMALAKEYEDLADYPKAFTHLVRGKSAGGVGRTYSIRQDEELFAAIEASFPQPQPVVEGHPTNEPIFIIGMPRTGTTLVERIVSSHPDVHSAGELLNFGMALKQVAGSRSPALIDTETVIRARNADWKQLGEIYLSSTRPSTGQKPRFIDKLPHNFLYAGFIAKALPNAKIICLRRDPLDTCLSNFRQLLSADSAYFGYSFDLLDTGRYYVLFDRLMAHWQRTFPGRILEIQYETLVDTQESTSRRLLEFCGLPWNDACMRFEENQGAVATASAVQVRAPIYRNALKRWKNYEPQLGELQALLRDAGIPLET